MPGATPIRIPAGGWKTVPTTAEPIPNPPPRPPTGTGSGLPLPGGDAPIPSPSQSGPGRYWLRDPYWKKAPLFPDDKGGFLPQPQPGPLNQRLEDPAYPGSPYTWGDIAGGNPKARDDFWELVKRRQSGIPEWLQPLPSPIQFPPGTVWRVKYVHPDTTTTLDFSVPVGGAAAFPANAEDLNAFQPWQYVVERPGNPPFVSSGNFHSGPPSISITVIPPAQAERPYEPIPEPIPATPPLDWKPMASPGFSPARPTAPSPAFSPGPGFKPFAEPESPPIPSPIPVEPNPGPGPLVPAERPSPAPIPPTRRNPDRRSPVPGDRDYGRPAPGSQPPTLPSGKPSPTGIPFPLPIPELFPVPVPYPSPEPESQPDPGSGGGDDCAIALQLVKELVRRNRQQECNCCEIVQESVSIFNGCDEETGLPSFQDVDLPCLKGTEALIKQLFDELAQLRARECFSGSQNVEPYVIESGQSTTATRTFYVELPSETRSLILIITGQLPSTLSLYQTSSEGEAQGKFGNIACCAKTPGNGWAQQSDPGWIWTRRTYHRVPESNLTVRAIRLNLQPGLSWVLYDSGER